MICDPLEGPDGRIVQRVVGMCAGCGPGMICFGTMALPWHRARTASMNHHESQPESGASFYHSVFASPYVKLFMVNMPQAVLAWLVCQWK